jgi:transaldolase
VNTLPEVTWKAFNDHGTLARTVDRHLDEAHRTLRELGQLGIDMERVGAQLQVEGVGLFSKAFADVVDIVAQKRNDLLTGEGG